MTTTATTTATPDARTVPLEQIVVLDGFNPRERFDDAELDRLARSLSEVGMLQPLIVYQADDDRFELGDGERRYRAARRAGLTEVPVVVRAREEDGRELVESVVVNLHRAQHSPVEEAKAFQRLLDGGLTRKGVGERLSVTRERVRERLELLKVPAELHEAIDAGEIPLSAVKVLVDLAAIHPELPVKAAACVRAEPRHSWDAGTTWADVVEDPIGAVTPRYDDEHPDLPDGVFDADSGYPLTAFSLTEHGAKRLAALTKLEPRWGSEPVVRLGGPEFEQAEALGAAHSSAHRCSRLVVGQQVADQLVDDLLKRELRDARARPRRARPSPGARRGGRTGP